MTLDELEILEKYNREKIKIEQERKEKLETLDKFRKYISSEGGINIYFTLEEECKKRTNYDKTTNPVFSFFRTSQHNNYNVNNVYDEEISKKCKERVRKLMDLIIKKCEEENNKKIENLEVYLKNV